jgi:hypothetical protein
VASASRAIGAWFGAGYGGGGLLKGAAIIGGR